MSQTRDFVNNPFLDGTAPASKATIARMLPLISRSAVGSNHVAKKEVMLEELVAFFEGYFGLFVGGTR